MKLKREMVEEDVVGCYVYCVINFRLYVCMYVRRMGREMLAGLFSL